ncbi:MAG: PTS sugar transporter subunit IIA [Deltaproteobacteria bacterium]|nr:PTS sugar transporter subunit IIA [Deltaproteobacteria bacterium]
MIGIIVITHAQLGQELINAAEFILGKIERIVSLDVASQSQNQEIQSRLEAAIRQMESGDGVLILTDMFGGTPNNVSLAFWAAGRVEVVTGVNLPMLIKAATSREGKSLSDLGREVCDAGKESISVAGELLSI